MCKIEDLENRKFLELRLYNVGSCVVCVCLNVGEVSFVDDGKEEVWCEIFFMKFNYFDYRVFFFCLCFWVMYRYKRFDGLVLRIIKKLKIY